MPQTLVSDRAGETVRSAVNRILTGLVLYRVAGRTNERADGLN
jgi:hypothetical protein